MEIKNFKMNTNDLINEIEAREGYKYSKYELKEMVSINSYNSLKCGNGISPESTYFISKDEVFVPTHVSVKDANRVLLADMLIPSELNHSKAYDEVAKTILTNPDKLSFMDYQSLCMIELEGKDPILYYSTFNGNLINLETAAIQMDYGKDVKKYTKIYDGLCGKVLKLKTIPEEDKKFLLKAIKYL